MSEDNEQPIDMQWLDAIAVDKAILTPKSTSTELVVAIPKFVKKKVAVIYRQPNGNAMFQANGQPYYVMEEQNIMVDVEKKKVPLPGQEIFNIDLVSSFLNQYDVASLRKAQRIYVDLQLQILKGKDKIDDLHFVYGLMMSLVNTAKAREGQAVRLSKTAISESATRQTLSQEIMQEEQKKKRKEVQQWG